MSVTRVLKLGNTEGSSLQLLPWLELGSTEPSGQIEEQPATAPAQPSPPRLTDLDLEHAFQRGLREGREANRAAQESAAAAVRAELAKAVAEFSSLRSSLRRSAQMDMLRLAVAIARRIVHRELSLSPDIMEGIVSVALEKLDRQESYRVRVHPSLATGVEREIRTFAHHQNVQVIPDENLAVGACRVETNRGNVDASIESQLLEIERGLADRLETAR